MSPERKGEQNGVLGRQSEKGNLGQNHGPGCRTIEEEEGGRLSCCNLPSTITTAKAGSTELTAEGKGGGGGERRLLSLSSPPLAALTAAGEKGKAWFVPAPSSFPLLLLYFRAGFLASPFRYLFLALWSYGLMDAPQFMMIVILFLLSLVAGTSFGGIFRSRFLIRAWLDLLSESVSGLGSWEFGLVCLPMSAMLICAGVCRFRSLDCSTCPFHG